MVCRKCGNKVEKGWRFCPNCGSTLQPQRRSLFDDIFSRFKREFGEMDRMFDKEFEVLDLSPFFGKSFDKRRGWYGERDQRRAPVNRKGFTIRITRRGQDRPRVNVHTFGNIKNEDVRKEIKEKMRSLGMGPPGQPRQFPAANEPVPATGEPYQKTRAQEPAKLTEEPTTNAKVIGNKVIVDMELPDVKSESDIDVQELESSVEVRARAGDKAYFKIITKPGHSSVTSRRFVKGKLHMEFS
jgi:HSP20 family molecular chaperone IbpA